MPPKGTADPIGRTFKMIKLVNDRKDGFTMRDIMDTLNCSYSVAQYFLDHASIHMPIALDGKKVNGTGNPANVYRLLKGNESWSGKDIL